MKEITKLIELGYSFKVVDGQIVPSFNRKDKVAKAISEPLFAELKKNKEKVLQYLQFDTEYFSSKILDTMSRINKLKVFDKGICIALLYNSNIKGLEKDIDRYYQEHDSFNLAITLNEYEETINEMCNNKLAKVV